MTARRAILALDTTTRDSGVGLLVDGVPRAARQAQVTAHSDALLLLVRDVLAEAGLGLGELTAIACGAGPGSFTGLRIGLATAKGLCFALDRPLLLVPSLQALAARAPAGALAVGCLDAFKGEVYAAFFRLDADGEPRAEGLEQALPPAQLATRLAERARREPLHLIGNGAARWGELLVPGVIADDRGPPAAFDIARLAARRLARGETDDVATVGPRYVRPSEAELLHPDGLPGPRGATERRG